MKKVLDILGIALPALIIILGITRIFVKKTKGINGLIMLFAILLLIAGLVRYFAFPDNTSRGEDNKATPLTVSKHSEAFNTSLEKALTAYYSLTSAFAGKDTIKINSAASNLSVALDSFRLEELKADSLIYETAVQPYQNAKAELNAILSDPSVEEKRLSLNILSNELFALLSTVRYDRAKLFWQECSNAFGEGRPGNWISKNEQDNNPYGKEGCSEVRTTLNFVPADSVNHQ